MSQPNPQEAISKYQQAVANGDPDSAQAARVDLVTAIVTNPDPTKTLLLTAGVITPRTSLETNKPSPPPKG